MRSKSMLRSARPVQLGAGVAMLAISASAVALAAGQADAQSAIQLTLTPRHAAFGRPVQISGTATGASAGQSLTLEFSAGGRGTWQPVRTTKAGPSGGFQFSLPARESGLLRVLPSASSSTGGTTAPGVGSAADPGSSSPEHLSVAAQFRVAERQRVVLGSQTAHVYGKLLPGVGGRRVHLLLRQGGRWRSIASARTGSRGGFQLTVPGWLSGQHWLRVGFAGDRENTAAQAHAGNVTTFQQTVASWYDDGGATACGFHAYYGVANLSLPCGAQVTFRLGGRQVTATVDDRGPYVGGRDWDLNQNTASALGFDGVGAVWSSS